MKADFLPDSDVIEGPCVAHLRSRESVPGKVSHLQGLAVEYSTLGLAGSEDVSITRIEIGIKEQHTQSSQTYNVAEPVAEHPNSGDTSRQHPVSPQPILPGAEAKPSRSKAAGRCRPIKQEQPISNVERWLLCQQKDNRIPLLGIDNTTVKPEVLKQQDLNDAESNRSSPASVGKLGKEF
ncbi:hypothetical protein MMC12_004636 [Toensbergia leucococca]|nr:hypothetical protein [Toensbergia leucococca]